MTKIVRKSLMYATVSGCAQAPVVRDDDRRKSPNKPSQRVKLDSHDGTAPGAAPKTQTKSK